MISKYNWKFGRGKHCRNCYTKAPTFRRLSDKSWKWQGGRWKNKQGYILTKVYPDNPFYAMNMGKYRILEHRFIMAKQINRCLMGDELVHHLNGVRDDNRPENLVLQKKSDHPSYTFIKALQKRIRQLEQASGISPME